MIESADKPYIDELSKRVRHLEALVRHLAPRHPHCARCHDLLGPPQPEAPLTMQTYEGFKGSD